MHFDTKKPTDAPLNVLDVLASAVRQNGWQIDDEEDMEDQDCFSFTLGLDQLKYTANVQHLAADALHLELIVALEKPVSFILYPSLIELLNLINQHIPLGSLVHCVEEEGEFLVHRSQLVFDESVGITERQAVNLLKSSMASYDLCLSHILIFLATKPRARVGKTREIEEIYLVKTPEETLEFIIHGPTIGRA